MLLRMEDLVVAFFPGLSQLAWKITAVFSGQMGRLLAPFTGSHGEDRVV